MKSLVLKGLILASIVSLLLVSCSGGGSNFAGGGIDGTGIMSAGVVSAFGSIIVNGTEFDTSTAAIIINGEQIGVGDDFVLANLAIGMVVTVEGRINADGSAVADRVIYRINVAGPVESISNIDPTAKEIVILGQTVFVNVITKYKPGAFGFDSITLNDVVEVSGYLDDNGAIRATFLEKIGDTTTILDYEVTGFVENLSPLLKTFTINGLTVDYSLIENSLPEGIPADALFVEVEGRLGAGGELIASNIEPGDVLGGDDGDEVEIMGFVTEIISVNDIIKFKVGHQEIHADLNPDIVIYVDGDPADIVLGQKLEAEGSLEGGILSAWEIEFWKPDQIEVEGLVCCIVSDSEFTVGDQVVQTDGDTIFEPEDLIIRDNIRIEVKGVPADIDHSVIEADKVSLELD